MKIGIITLPIRTNYGGILQAYALQRVLKNMGHEAVTIKKDRNIPLWIKPAVYTKRFLMKYVLRRKNAINVFHEQYQKRILPIITQNTQTFIDKYIEREDFDITKNCKKEFGAFIVGSDQIWRPKYIGDIANAYLKFAENWNVRRISYAASFGTDEWEYSVNQTRICKDLVSKFDAISVRENAGIDLCKKHFNVDAIEVLDPTMLLDVSHYLSLFENDSIEKNTKGLFVYVLDKNEDTNKIECQIRATLQYDAFYTSTDNSSAKLEDRIATKVENWLQSFYEAKFILTDSFHACVFSILFNKPFVVYGNAGRGLSRFDSLLHKFDLLDRRVGCDDKNLAQILDTPINWDNVNEILKRERQKSFNFLEKAINQI